jgi:hypothetical protein
MTIFRNTRDGRLYTVTYGLVPITGILYAHPYNRAGESFKIKGRAAWEAFIPVGTR